MSNLSKAVHNPFKAFRVLLNNVLSRNAFLIKDDERFIRMKWRLCMDYPLNLSNPQSFSEKLQWLKLYNHIPEYTKMVDKYAAKEYVSSIIGDEYIIPTLGVWEDPELIDWESLPEKFVLKCTHDSATVTIVKNKSLVDKKSIIEKYKRLLKRDYYRRVREWPYKDVPHRIIAEEYVEPSHGNNDLPDYKFFCFDGEVQAMFIATERQNPNEAVKFDFFDADFNHLPFRQGHDHAKQLPQKPLGFEKMKQLASKLSKGIPHVRIDFYEVGDKILFGEMTFFHFSGFKPFEPKAWDYKFGEWLTLPKTKRQ